MLCPYLHMLMLLELPVQVPGGSLPVNIYGCLFAGSMSFFRSELYQSYFQESLAIEWHVNEQGPSKVMEKRV